MKNVKMTVAAVWAWALVSGALAGRVATFTGAVSTDLSVGENWDGGTVPGDDAVAVVDFAKLGDATAVTNSADLALAGLVLTNLPPNATLWGTNAQTAARTTLTLGASGLRTHRLPGAASNLTVNVHLATAANQVWLFADEKSVTFNGTITGTAYLAMTNDCYLTHNVPPNYGGTIRYGSRNRNTFNCVQLRQKGPWAQDVEMGHGRLELCFGGPADWAEIFPRRLVRLEEDAMLLATFPGPAHVAFNDGDTFSGASARQGWLVLDTGSFTQNGGAVTSQVQVGFSSNPSLYAMKGGFIRTGQLALGHGASTHWATNQEFRLTGGTVEAGEVNIAYRANGAPASHVDLAVEGGTLTASGNGIVLVRNRRDANWAVDIPSASASFRQTGGTVRTSQIAFGPLAGDSAASSTFLTNAWANVALDGGLLDIGARGFNLNAARWNVAADGSAAGNARYRVSLKSGTLAASAPFTSELDFVIPSNTVPLTVDTREHDVTFAAPLWGSGAIEKSGSGTLTVLDGTRHRGRIDVKAGALKLMGAPSADDTVDGETCWLWRADDAVQGLDDGAEIETWPDTTGTRSAVYDGISKNGEAVTKPTVERNAFNGHAGVAFNRSALKVAADLNPLAGATNWTVCVVLKTSEKGLGSRPAWYKARGVLGREEAGVVNDWGLVFDQNGHFGAGLGVGGSGDSCLYAQRANAADGVPHVVFYSLDADGTRTLVVDGEVRRDTVALNAGTKSPRNKADIYFGVQNIGDDGPKHFAFIGTIAEIRFYPDKALTPGERAGLGATLAARYGASSDVGGTGADDALKGELAQTATEAPMPDDGATAWDAASLAALDDGAAVERWSSLDGAHVADLATGRLRMTGTEDLATAENGGIQAPRLVKGALNGHPVVRFNGSAALGIPAAHSPVSGRTAWTVAMVFRTGDTDHPGTDRQFFRGRALFGAELPGVDRADWGVTFWNERGRILAGYGGRNAGKRDHNFANRARDLNDGEPHILIATFDTDAGIGHVQVDGVGVPERQQACSSATPREAMRVLIGSMNGDAFFQGDIAAFRLYGRVLSEAEKQALLDGWTDRFAVPPAPRSAHAAFASGRLGLGATNIAVAAGAALVLPVAERAPFTLKDGQRLTVAGTVKGTLGVGAGGVLDFAAARPTAFDDLWLRSGGTVRASLGQAAPVALGTFRAEGRPVLELVDVPARMPATFTLFTYAGDAALAEGLDWALKGASPASRVVVEDGRVMVRTAIGTTVIFR